MEHHKPVRKSSLINEQPIQRIIIGVAGGSAAGKTTLCQNINRQMAFDRNFRVQMVSLDSFYKSLDTTIHDPKDYNFDHPNSLDFDLAYSTLKAMKQTTGQKVPIPQYSFIHHKRLSEPTYAHPANIILFEGLMAFHDQRIRNLMTYKVFITCDDDIRLCRRLKRDISQRGRTIQSVLLQYNRFVKDSFKNFILPTMVYADIVIPGFRNNRVSVDFIVQHIKNIARRINYRQSAAKTKIYIFGQNQLFDFQYCNSPQFSMTLGQESFLVFPTAQQHKKQLEFFMNRLISQTFNYEYFQQIYLCQFIKIQKSLLNQLIFLKEYKKKNIQIFTSYNIKQIQKHALFNHNKKVKIIFAPIAITSHSTQIIDFIKKVKRRQPDTGFVVLTIFCDLKFPSTIYKLALSNLILINLFVIANQKRFRQTINHNLISRQKTQRWIQNDHNLSHLGALQISKELNINYISQYSIQQIKYNNSIKSQKKQLIKRQLTINQRNINQWQQKYVYSQQHQNLCGYHTLINIILISKKLELTSKEKFIQYYSIMSKIVKNQNYSVLQRTHIQPIISAMPQFNQLTIKVFYYSTGYIQNTIQQLNDIQKCINSYNSKSYNGESFFLIMGIHDHFFLLEIPERKYQNVKQKKNSIYLYDSANISVKDIIKGTDVQYYMYHDKQKVTQQQQQFLSYRKHMKNTKQALQIIYSALCSQRTLQQSYIQKRIDQICVLFNNIIDKKQKISQTLIQKQIKKYFQQQYPVPVIINDLLKPLKKLGINILSKQYKNVYIKWRSHPIIQENVFKNQGAEFYV